MRRAKVHCRETSRGAEQGPVRYLPLSVRARVSEQFRSARPSASPFPSKRPPLSRRCCSHSFRPVGGRGGQGTLQCRVLKDRRERPFHAAVADRAAETAGGVTLRRSRLATTRCPGCASKPNKQTLPRGLAGSRLLGGKKVPFILPFSRPDYDQVKLEVSHRPDVDLRHPDQEDLPRVGTPRRLEMGDAWAGSTS